MNIIRQNIENNVRNFDPASMTSSGGVIQRGGRETKLLPKWVRVDELDLSTLRYCSLYLTDVLLCQRSSVILPDHIQYWAWTAAFASQYIKQGSRYMPLLEDFYSIVHVFLLSERHKHLDSGTRNDIAAKNRSIQPFVQHMPYKFATLPSFPTLEGLVYRHCNKIDSNGKATEEIEITERDIGPISRNCPVYLYNALQTWIFLEATPEVRGILRQIDVVNPYKARALNEKFSDIDGEDFESIVSEEDSLLYYLKAVRNTNLHGGVRTQLMGIIAINLICLLIWDVIDGEMFELKRDFLSGYTQGNSEKIMEMIEEHPEWVGKTTGIETDELSLEILDEITPSGDSRSFYPVYED